MVVVDDARKKLAAIMNKLSIRILEAEDVPLLGEGKQEKRQGKRHDREAAIWLRTAHSAF